mmetsp:Transcript_479/g.675  ORF Transcript_479/g.675 Transcript_479/m.675 type:complete len:260 (-) Transcript_479:560-1339(-)
MEGLQRVDDHSSNLMRTVADYVHGCLAHILESEHVSRKALVAGHRLHAVPPAVVRAPEYDDILFASVEAYEAGGCHYGFSATHMERNLCFSGYFAQHVNVLTNERVNRAQDTSNILGEFPPFSNKALVLFVPAHVNTVRPRHISKAVAINIDKIGSIDALDHSARVAPPVEFLLEGNKDSASRAEAKVGEFVAKVSACFNRFRELFAPLLVECVERFFPLLSNFFWGAIGTKKVMVAKGPSRHNVRHNREDERNRSGCL